MTRHGFRVPDATLEKSIALPASDGSVYTASIDLGAALGDRDFVAECELLINAPVLTTTELPDDDTATYKLQHSTDDSTFTTLSDAILVQTGASSAGAAAASVRARIPTDAARYIRLAVTTAGTSGDCSGKSATLKLKF